MNGAEFISIPRNIKQQMVPFVIEPVSQIITTNIAYTPGESKFCASEKDIKNSLTSLNDDVIPQFFTFKKISSYSGRSNTGFLNICPSSYNNTKQTDEQEAALATLRSRQNTNNNKFDFHRDIINNIPSIQIKEFLEDAKLSQTASLFSAFSSGWKLAEQQASQTTGVKDAVVRVWDTLKTILNKMPKIIKQAISSVVDEFDKCSQTVNMQSNDDYITYIMKIPYILYYRMMSAFITNIYELPYNGNVVIESDGTEGWISKSIGELTTGTANNTALGTFLDWVGKNLKISRSPTWDGTEKPNGSSYTIQFTLFNDTLDSTLMNFIFINTLFPNNKWMQYHLYQHSPNLYDLNISGIGRIMMCSGSFSCKAIGQLKIPSVQFFTNLTKHINTKTWNSSKFIENLKKFDIIRIPDAYDVTLTFTSILPDSLNTYLFKFSETTEFETLKGKTLSIPSSIETVSTSIISEIEKIVNSTVQTTNQPITQSSEDTPSETAQTYAVEFEGIKLQLTQKTFVDITQAQDKIKYINDLIAYKQRQQLGALAPKADKPTSSDAFSKYDDMTVDHLKASANELTTQLFTTIATAAPDLNGKFNSSEVALPYPEANL